MALINRKKHDFFFFQWIIKKSVVIFAFIYTLTAQAAINFTASSDVLTDGLIRDIVVGHVDNDDVVDLILTQNNLPFSFNATDSMSNPVTLIRHHSALQIRLGNNDGSFQNAVSATNYFVASRPNVAMVVDSSNINATTLAEIGSHAETFLLMDVDGDGDNDIVSHHPAANVIALLENNGAGIYSQYYVQASINGPYHLHSADFNGDSEMDLVTVSTGDATIFARHSYANETLPTTLTTLDLPQLDSLVADFNNDGLDDVLLLDVLNQSVVLLLNTSTPAGAITFSSPITTMLSIKPYKFVSGDFNLDGSTDIAITTLLANSLVVLPGLGNGSFGAEVVTTDALLNGASHLAVADVDRDGLPDLWVCNIVNDMLYLYKGDGNHNFERENSVVISSSSPLLARAVDFNHDFLTDIIIVNAESNRFSTLLNTTTFDDADNDGLSDAEEILLGTSSSQSDSDNDGVSDFDEVTHDGNPANYQVNVDTDPLNSDTDGDGLLDGNDAEPTVPNAVNVRTVPTLAYLLLAGMLFGVWSYRASYQHTIYIFATWVLLVTHSPSILAATLTVETVAGLSAIDANQHVGDTVDLLGYHSVGDQGGGMLLIENVSAGNCANSQVINALYFLASDINFCFVRQHSGQLNIKAGGAFGNGINDDTSEIQAVIDTGLDILGVNGETYLLSQTSKNIGAFRAALILGDHQVIDLNGSTLKAEALCKCSVLFNEAIHRSYNLNQTDAKNMGIQVLNGIIDANFNTDPNINELVGLPGSLPFVPTIYLRALFDSVLSNLTIKNFYGSGLYIDQSKSLVKSQNIIINTVSVINGHGVGVHVNGLDHTVDGVYISGTRSLVVDGNNNNSPWGVHPNSFTMDAKNSTIGSLTFDDCEWGFKLQGSSENITIDQITATATQARAVKFQGTSSSLVKNVRVNRVESSNNYLNGIYFVYTENIIVKSYFGDSNGAYKAIEAALDPPPATPQDGKDYTDIYILWSNASIEKAVSNNSSHTILHTIGNGLGDTKPSHIGHLTINNYAGNSSLNFRNSTVNIDMVEHNGSIPSRLGRIESNSGVTDPNRIRIRSLIVANDFIHGLPIFGNSSGLSGDNILIENLRQQGLPAERYWHSIP